MVRPGFALACLFLSRSSTPKTRLAHSSRREQSSSIIDTCTPLNNSQCQHLRLAPRCGVRDPRLLSCRYGGVQVEHRPGLMSPTKLRASLFSVLTEISEGIHIRYRELPPLSRDLELIGGWRRELVLVLRPTNNILQDVISNACVVISVADDVLVVVALPLKSQDPPTMAHSRDRGFVTSDNG
jgi:hypothetical protein